MPKKILKAKIPLIKKPITKKVSGFLGGNAFSSAKVIPNKDAYKRV
ncbi:MAG: hypothetical protein WC149_02890 [Arcobacteraceae bacterium]